MSERRAGKRILDGLREALSYVRGDCSHRWKQRGLWDGYTKGEHRYGVVRECTKCGIAEYIITSPPETRDE
jgi:hypothetical protein